MELIRYTNDWGSYQHENLIIMGNDYEVIANGQLEINENTTVMNNIQVKEKYMNQGFGTQIIKSLIEIFNNEVKDKPLWLLTHKENLIANNIYKKNGFEESDSYISDYRFIWMIYKK